MLLEKCFNESMINMVVILRESSSMYAHVYSILAQCVQFIKFNVYICTSQIRCKSRFVAFEYNTTRK